MALVDSLLRGATVEVSSNVTPPMRFDAAGLVDGSPPSPLMRLLRPRVTLRHGSTVLFESAPYDGAPVPWGWVAALAGAMLLSLLLAVLVRSL